MTVEFIINRKQKLNIGLTNLSQDTLGYTLLWDFGDGNTSVETNPSHTYSSMGRYTITLTYTKDEEVKSYSQTIMVSDKVYTTLSDTIYLLINNLLPEALLDGQEIITMQQKQNLIQKWQLYIGPLVNHKIFPDNYYNELYFEALENQLIMELAAYDFAVVRVNKLIQNLSTAISVSSSSSESDPEGNGDIKHITTGPTEVEYFNKNEIITDSWSIIIKALNPEGVIALLKSQICMLSERLDIYLPICQRLPATRVVPRVVNRRKKTFLGGPDPIEIVK